jgi:hypothetical protein
MTVLLAFLVILVPASVTIVGYLFTQQANKRSEARLRLDAAMHAAESFGGSPDVEPNPASSAAGLLALTDLGRADLAVALLVDLWSDTPSTHGPDGGSPSSEIQSNAKHAVSNETAVLVINEALRAVDTPAAQLVAAELLCRNSERLNPCQSLDWPASIDGVWIPDLPRKAKILVTEGLIYMNCHSAFNEQALRLLVMRLYAISANDPDQRVKGCLGLLIDSLLPALERLPKGKKEEFMAARGTISYDQVCAAARLASPNPDGYMERVVEELCDDLKKWSSPACPLGDQRGALATAV